MKKTRRKIPASLLFVIVLTSLIATFHNHILRDLFAVHLRLPPSSLSLVRKQKPSLALQEDLRRPHLSTFLRDPPDSILFHDWEVVLVLPQGSSYGFTPRYSCLFQDGSTSSASPAGILPLGGRATFRCRMPFSVRRLRPFFTPVLTHQPEILLMSPKENSPTSPEMFRWNFLAYESFSTDDDVILFAKGVNVRQGVNVPATSLRCVFSNGVKTAVTSSVQEVFRCGQPDLPIPDGETLKISLEIRAEDGNRTGRVLPSVALYSPPPRNLAKETPPSLICACTMVYNAGKFLKEWVMYHAKIGVEKFVLYDNGSDDNLAGVVEKLLEAGYHVTTHVWPWPKTQEAGFSHCAVSYKDTCKYMAFVDVDEFIFSPSWANASQPSNDMIRSFLPEAPQPPVGQISIRCYEFGPSNRQSHPKDGVTQGYTCRKMTEERHKSIVLLEALDQSLLNLIHHFKLKEGYKTMELPKSKAVVNHYKYQAWSEFKLKFRRRVSAYVVDWKQAVNPSSKDRTPGLGFSPVEPKEWATSFCQVNDSQLKDVGRRWFGHQSPAGFKMAWEDQ